MIRFQNKNEFVWLNINEEEDSVSTLLIPELLVADFNLKKEKYNKNVSLYLRSLLRRFRSFTYTSILPEPVKIKTQFQDENLNLKKVSFRPRNSDWIELGELALLFGKSRCWVFVFLLKLDLLGLWDILVKAGLGKLVPTIPKVGLKVFWNLEKVNNHFTRGYYVRV